MTAAAYFRCSKVLDRLYKGPLGDYVDLYAARLTSEGHCYQSGARCIRVVGDFSLWLDRNHHVIDAVDERLVEQYLQFRVHDRRPFFSDRPALTRLLALLRQSDVISPPSPIVLGPLEQIKADFEGYLLQERGLAQVSVIRHRTPLRLFLRECCSANNGSFLAPTGAEITQFVVRHARDQSPQSARSMCWTIRAFLRYLLYRGDIEVDLATAVPNTRTWRFAPLPDHLSFEQVQLVLEQCDRSTAIGKRDYAVLLLLARLGLRANEVALMMLGDVNWHAALLTVRGKGRLLTSVPLLSEVGSAIADYLKHGRPVSDSRRVFLRSLAPHKEFSASSGISMIAKSALTCAGIETRRKGSHIFRHSLATHMLHAGATLPEIGQLLRHKNQDTTRIYAKVDTSALSQLSLPWPGGVQ